MQPGPPCSSPACWWQLGALGVVTRHCNLWVLIIDWLIFPPGYVALCDSKIPHRPPWECFLVFGNFSFKTPFLEWISVPTSFVSLFIFYIFPYLHSKTMGCLSGCLMSLCQHSKVVLWNLLSVQMFFRWICGGESGLPVLFLHHLRTGSEVFTIINCTMTNTLAHCIFVHLFDFFFLWNKHTFYQ